MRNGYIIDTLTYVGLKNIIRVGWKIIEMYEIVLYRKTLNPFEKDIEKNFKAKKL